MDTQRQTDQRTRMLPAGSLLFGVELHTCRTEGQEPSTHEHRLYRFREKDPQVGTTPRLFQIGRDTIGHQVHLNRSQIKETRKSITIKNCKATLIQFIDDIGSQCLASF